MLWSRTSSEAVRQQAVADVFDVGLVDGDQDVRRHRLDEAGQRVRVDDGGGRVVGVADEDQPGAVGDRGEHRVQVESVVGQRHLDCGGAGDLDLQRVELEAAPAEHHLVAGRGGDLDELLAQAHRSAADGDVLGSPTAGVAPDRVHVLGQRRLELDAAVVGVAVDAVGGALDRRADAGQRAVNGLVAGQFDRARHGLAGDVDRQLGQFGSQAGGHFDSICLGLCTLCSAAVPVAGSGEGPVPSGSSRRRARAAEWDSLLMSCPPQRGPEVQILSPPPPETTEDRRP